MVKLPRKTKSCAYSVRMDEKTHEAILALSVELGECRAVTTVELAKRGIEQLSHELGIDLSPEGVEAILKAHGVIE